MSSQYPQSRVRLVRFSRVWARVRLILPPLRLLTQDVYVLIATSLGLQNYQWDILRSGTHHAGPGSRLMQIVKWFGKDYDGAIVFDECHRYDTLPSRLRCVTSAFPLCSPREAQPHCLTATSAAGMLKQDRLVTCIDMSTCSRDMLCCRAKNCTIKERSHGFQAESKTSRVCCVYANMNSHLEHNQYPPPYLPPYPL